MRNKELERNEIGSDAFHSYKEHIEGLKKEAEDKDQRDRELSMLAYKA